jgi:hypothetical protein
MKLTMFIIFYAVISHLINTLSLYNLYPPSLILDLRGKFLDYLNLAQCITNIIGFIIGIIIFISSFSLISLYVVLIIYTLYLILICSSLRIFSLLHKLT